MSNQYNQNSSPYAGSLAMICPVKNLSIDELIYVKMGEYKPMYSRPYKAIAHESALQALATKMASNRQANVTAGSLSGITSGLIYPSSVPILSGIDNNWVNERKYLFWLKATVEDTFNIVRRYYLQGYTNYDGITNNGTGDMGMEHTVNTIIETIIVTHNTPYGIVEKERLGRVYNVSHANTWQTDCYLQRPSDIYNNMDSFELLNNIGSYGSFEDVHRDDTRTTVSNGDVVNKTSVITNNVPTMFLADVINAGVNGSNELNFNATLASEASLASQSVNRFNDPDIKNNQFLKALSYMNGTRRYGVFSLGELTRMDPTINDRFKLFNITKEYVDVTTASTPNVGEFWDGQDGTTLSAYSIIESSVSLATKYGFSKLYFSCSNTFDATGTVYAVITNYKSLINLEDMEYAQLLELFKSAFISNVFMDESRNNSVPMTFHMYVDIFGTSKLSIMDTYGRDVWYTIPTFANSSFSPVMTVDKSNLDDMSVKVTGIVDWLDSNLSRIQY